MKRSQSYHRDTCAEAIARIDSPKALAALLEAAKSRGTRASAIGAMRALTSPPEDVLLSATRDRDEKVRGAAILAFAYHDSTSARRAVRRALGDLSPWVRWHAAHAAGQLKDEASIPGLVACLGDRGGSARASLVHIGSASVKPLMAALRSPSTLARREAADALGQLKDPRAVPALQNRFYDDSSLVQRVAARAIEAITHKLPAMPTVPLTTNPSRLVEMLRWNKAGLAKAQLALMGPRVRPHLLPLLKDPEPEIRQDAVWTLGRLGDPRAMRAVLGALEDPSADVREEAAKCLLNEGSAGWPLVIEALSGRNGGDVSIQLSRRGKWSVPILMEALKSESATARSTATGHLTRLSPGLDLSPGLADPDAHARFTAALAMAGRRDKRAADTLGTFLGDRDPEIRWRAASALSGLRDKRGDPVLRRVALDSKEEPNRRGNALFYIQDKSLAVDVALALLYAKDKNLTYWAADHLGTLGDKRAVEPLCKRLDQPGGSFVANALGRLGDTKAVPSLIRALKEPEDFGRMGVGIALIRLGDPTGVDAALKLLDDEIYYVRRDVAKAFGEWRRTAAVPAIIRLLRDEATDVRREAAEALGLLGDRSALEPLRKMAAEDPSPECKQAAKTSIAILGG